MFEDFIDDCSKFVNLWEMSLPDIACKSHNTGIASQTQQFDNNPHRM